MTFLRVVVCLLNCLDKNLVSIFNFKGEPSEICKFALFSDWLKTYQKLKSLKLMNNFPKFNILKQKIASLNELVYSDIKKMSDDYQEMKIKVFF
jgi:hypothetical protein